MPRLLLFVGFLVVLVHGYGAQQVQMPEAGALYEPDEDLNVQVQALQRNISELWTYINALKTSVTQHLNHLRQHQVEMESTVRKLEHGHDGQGGMHAAHTDDHHHSGEPHSHSGEHHSHSGEHHHSGEQHHHSGEDHSHGGDQHSHSGEHHSHDSHDSHSHDSHSHSHSHGSDGSHSSHEGSDHSHSHDHRDSHETEDDLQQSQQVAEPLVEPVVVPSQSHSHNHQHPHSSHRSSSSTFKPIQLMGRSDHHHHHHHDHHPTINRTRTPVVMPKFSEYALYDFAVCHMQPNRAIPEGQQQEVVGQISLWQRKTGGPLNIHVKLQGFSVGDHHGAHQAIQQEEDNETPNPSGHRHGFHVHTNGDLSNGCQSTGPHFNPKSTTHGGPNALVRHVGDLGNIECDEHGIANIVFSDKIASLKGQYSIVGKSMVIHSGEDDYGLGGDDESLRTGNAGTRIACCIIEKVDKLPIRSYKAIKSASQYQN